jgi:hypothetical protein
MFLNFFCTYKKKSKNVYRNLREYKTDERKINRNKNKIEIHFNLGLLNKPVKKVGKEEEYNHFTID